MNTVAQNTLPVSRSFHVMTKPIGPLCNLKCDYCYYFEKKNLFPPGEQYKMSDTVLETYVRDYIRSQHTSEINFAWQGGEPSLLGLDFFRKVVALQRQYSDGRTVSNAFQTNGTNLDDEWCQFFFRENFLIGLSLDGPEPIHNRYRVDQKGEGSFARVFEALERLKKWRVEFNTLTCVTRESPDEAVEIYRFLKKQGVVFMQFIPIVERAGDRAAEGRGLGLAGPPDLSSKFESNAMMPWSVSSKGFGTFLCAIFDEWVKEDVGRIFVNAFDAALSAWYGMEPSLCTLARTCGQAVAMEHNGRVYSCDHYVYPDYALGNIMEKSLEEMVFSEEQIKFGRDKQDRLSNDCRICEFLFACNGECPKHRFIKPQTGGGKLSYLCEGYKKFFKHVDPVMKEMAALIRQGRPAAEIMSTFPSSSSVGRNDPCPCGRARKFKKCCGR